MATRRALTRMGRVVAAGSVALLVGTGGVAFAAGNPEAPAAPICSVSPNPVGTNSSVTVSGTGFAPGSTETITGTAPAKVTNATATADSSGTLSITEQVGSAGTATFTVTGALPNGTSGSCQASGTVSPAGTTNRRSQVGSVSDSSVDQGGSTTFSGCGYKPGSTVVITDTAGHSYGTAVVGKDGCFHKKITFSNPGDYTLVATGTGANGGVLVTTAHVHVKGLTVTRNNSGSSGGTGNNGGLAFTGADGIGTLLLVGAGMVGAGSGFLARSRRRRLVESR